MKLFIEEEKVLQIDENIKLVLLNSDDFISIIKESSKSIPAPHISANLKYKLIYNDDEYKGESNFDSYEGIKSNIDTNSPYNVELVNWNLSDKDEKYFEFNFEKKYN